MKLINYLKPIKNNLGLLFKVDLRASFNHNFTNAKSDISFLNEKIKKLEKELSVQKGRITRQTREQNKEKKLFEEHIQNKKIHKK